MGQVLFELFEEITEFAMWWILKLGRALVELDAVYFFDFVYFSVGTLTATVVEFGVEEDEDVVAKVYVVAATMFVA